jgi:transposase
VDEVRRAEFFRKGGAARDLVRGKRWLLLTSWLNLDRGKRRQLNALFALNRRILKAYLLKESLSHLWDYSYEGAMLRYLQKWIDQLRWQRLKPMEKLAQMLLDHLEGILNYCRTKVPMGVVEAVNGNIKALLRRDRGYRDMNYLLLKAQRLAATKTEFVAFQKAAQNAHSYKFLCRTEKTFMRKFMKLLGRTESDAERIPRDPYAAKITKGSF